MNRTLPQVTAQNYFSPEIEAVYMGSTQFKGFQRCEAAELARLRGAYRREKTPALLVGGYVDAYFEGTLDRFKEENPGIFRRDGALRAELLQAETIIRRMEADGLYMLLMSGEKQVIRTGELAGVPFKIKMDSLLSPAACAAISRRFPAAAEAFGLGNGAIVDQKVVRSFADVWDETRRVRWWKYWRYDLQGAIYQAVEGRMLPFILAAGTKEEQPDLQAVYLRDQVLEAALAEVEALTPRFQAVKEGRERPRRCGRCAYCRATRRLSGILDADSPWDIPEEREWTEDGGSAQ